LLVQIVLIYLFIFMYWFVHLSRKNEIYIIYNYIYIYINIIIYIMKVRYKICLYTRWFRTFVLKVSYFWFNKMIFPLRKFCLKLNFQITRRNSVSRVEETGRGAALTVRRECFMRGAHTNQILIHTFINTRLFLLFPSITLSLCLLH